MKLEAPSRNFSAGTAKSMKMLTTVALLKEVRGQHLPNFSQNHYRLGGNYLGVFIQNVRPDSIKITILMRLVSTVFSFLTTLGKLNMPVI
jgi:hypothetical protein